MVYTGHERVGGRYTARNNAQRLFFLFFLFTVLCISVNIAVVHVSDDVHSSVGGYSGVHVVYTLLHREAWRPKGFNFLCFSVGFISTFSQHFLRSHLAHKKDNDLTCARWLLTHTLLPTALHLERWQLYTCAVNGSYTRNRQPSSWVEFKWDFIFPLYYINFLQHAHPWPWHIYKRVCNTSILVLYCT